MNREEQRKTLYSLLGDLPDRSRKIEVVKVAEEISGTYVLEKLTLDLNGIEPVPAYLVRPRNQVGPVPAVLYNHAHGGDYVLGKDELLYGRDALQKPPYAEALAKNGFAALCVMRGHLGRGEEDPNLRSSSTCYGMGR